MKRVIHMYSYDVGKEHVCGAPSYHDDNGQYMCCDEEDTRWEDVTCKKCLSFRKKEMVIKNDR